MKRILSPILLAVIFAVSSCSEDFEVAAPYQDVTVVYSILDPQDTAHYIRIQKAFLDENKSAIDMSKVPDSSFYTQLDVKLKEFSDEKGKTLSNMITLDNRVDLNKEGYVKDPAANNQGFFQSPNYAYKFTDNQLTLNPYLYYRLVITNKATGNVDSTDLFGIVDADSARSHFYIAQFNKLGYTFDFARTDLNATYSLIGNVPRNGYMVEGKIRFHYIDRNILTNDTIRKYVDFPFGKDEGTGQFNLQTENKNIYSFLSDAMGAAPSNIERYMGRCDFYIYAGSFELYQNRQVNLAQAGSISSDQIKPYYTNLRGKNVLGLVASRTYRFYPDAIISNQTIESLKVNPLTQTLNIKGKIEP